MYLRHLSLRLLGYVHLYQKDLFVIRLKHEPLQSLVLHLESTVQHPHVTRSWLLGDEPNASSHFRKIALSKSLAQEVLLIGVRCEKSYINV